MTPQEEMLLRVGTEGGSLSLNRCDGSATRLVVRLSEMDYGVDDLDALDEVIGEADSMQEALALLDRYPWSRLAVIELAPEVETVVLAGVEDRGGVEARERWCGRIASLRARERAIREKSAHRGG